MKTSTAVGIGLATLAAAGLAWAFSGDDAIKCGTGAARPGATTPPRVIGEAKQQVAFLGDSFGVKLLPTMNSTAPAFNIELTGSAADGEGFRAWSSDAALLALLDTAKKAGASVAVVVLGEDASKQGSNDLASMPALEAALAARGLRALWVIPAKNGTGGMDIVRQAVDAHQWVIDAGEYPDTLALARAIATQVSALAPTA